MKRRATFDAKAVAELIAHAKAAKEHTPSYSDLEVDAYYKGGKVVRKENGWPDSEALDLTKIPAALHLVGDHGIYLMANSRPGLMLPGKANSHKVAYAKESDPTSGDPDWYDAKRRIFGGDDGAETIAIDRIEEWIANGAIEITVDFEDDSYSIGATFPKPKSQWNTPEEAITAAILAGCRKMAEELDCEFHESACAELVGTKTLRKHFERFGVMLAALKVVRENNKKG